jgi:hypothetical protein
VHWWRGVLRMRAWRPRMLEERGMWNTMDNKKEHMYIFDLFFFAP